MKDVPVIVDTLGRLKMGIPKTIDHYISYFRTTFGFGTAVSEPIKATYAANAKAAGARNGISLLKLMGRDSGVIAVCSVLVDSQVDFSLITGASLSGIISNRSAWRLTLSA